MYSKNDYRYYLEHRLEESDDYLAHYGVKGMKWKHHLKSAKNTMLDAYGTLTDEAQNAGQKVKKGAKKAYKYADKHVDRYTYKYSVPDHYGRVSKKTGKPIKQNTYGAGILVKTKKRDVGVGGYVGSTDRGDSKVGISVYRDNKKKRKRSYSETGISTRYGGSYQRKKSSSKY